MIDIVNNSDPLISVVMATKNPCKEKFLEAVDSLLNQDYSNIEIIIVDDASDYSITNLIKNTYLHDNSNIKVIINNKSIGLAHALNIGILHSSGNIIARLDDDDYAYPSRIRRQIAALKKNDADCCFTGIEVYNEQNSKCEKLIDKKLCNVNIREKLLLHGNPFCHSSAMFYKSVVNDVGGYDEELKYAQDYDLWIRISKKYKIIYLPEVLVRWRNIGEKKSKRKEALQTAYCVYSRYKTYLDSKQGLCDTLKLIYSNIYLLLQILFVKRKQFR